MALALAVGDLITARLNFTIEDQGKAFNVLHYKVGSVSGLPPTMATALVNMANAIYLSFGAEWVAISSEQVTFDSVTCWNVHPLPRSVGVSYVPGSAAVGALTDQALPAQDAPTIVKRTEVGQKWGIGRLFIVGGAEVSQEMGVIIPASRAAYNAYAAKFDDNVTIAGAGYGCVLVPHIISGPESAPTRQTKVILTEMSDYVFKMQRRRRPGKGI